LISLNRVLYKDFQALLKDYLSEFPAAIRTPSIPLYVNNEGHSARFEPGTFVVDKPATSVTHVPGYAEFILACTLAAQKLEDDIYGVNLALTCGARLNGIVAFHKILKPSDQFEGYYGSRIFTLWIDLNTGINLLEEIEHVEYMTHSGDFGTLEIRSPEDRDKVGRMMLDLMVYERAEPQVKSIAFFSEHAAFIMTVGKIRIMPFTFNELAGRLNDSI